jgi:hypothetical protein
MHKNAQVQQGANRIIALRKVCIGAGLRGAALLALGIEVAAGAKLLRGRDQLLLLVAARLRGAQAISDPTGTCTCTTWSVAPARFAMLNASGSACSEKGDPSRGTSTVRYRECSTAVNSSSSNWASFFMQSQCHQHRQEVNSR